ncbi:MAG: AzlC family ABC transporter permease [Christensenellales bacterium]
MNSISKTDKIRALKAAFPHTLPICAGFLFLGFAYGIYMNSKGFSFLYPLLLSLTVFAGSMQFVAVNLLVSSFQPLYALALTLMVNARHLFYGLSMLEKYKGTGKKKLYLIFGMCDETFSVNCAADIPEDIDRGWFMLFVTLLNQLYWVTGATLGGILGSLITINTKGIDFVLIALFVVIFLDQWLSQNKHMPASIGVIASTVCLIVFGSGSFIIPAMLLILLLLSVMRNHLSSKEVKKCQ